MPIDPVSTGADFASRLVSNVYGLHKQEQHQQRADAERSRQSMISVLEGAAKSGNVNPEDMPALYSKLFELSGARSKDIATLTPHLQAAFRSPDTPRTTTFDYHSQVPAQTVGEGDFQTDVPAFSLPPVPTTETVNTPAIRMMGPQEKAGMAARAQLTAEQTLYPQKKKELDDAAQRKLEIQGAALNAKEKSRLAEITLKGGIDAQKKLNGYIAAYQGAGYDVDAATGLAGKALIREQDAAAAAKEQQAATGKARVDYLKGQLAVHQKNADTLSRRVDLYSKQLEEAARHNRANESNTSGKGGATTRNLKTFMANTKELYTALTPLNNQIAKLRADKDNYSDGVLLPEVAPLIQGLEKQRDEIKTKLDTARQTWLPQMPEPTDNVIPPVPGATQSAPTKGIIRRSNLGAVRSQNPSLAGMDDSALSQYLSAHGYVVK